MELLIPGLILVAFMVYASTRIKRVAAEAFEPETVETDDFTLDKPEGFLNVINRDPSLAFYAYSKDMGVGEAAEFRAGRAEIREGPDHAVTVVLAGPDYPASSDYTGAAIDGVQRAGLIGGSQDHLGRQREKRADHLIHRRLDRRGLTLAPRAVDGDQRLRA